MSVQVKRPRTVGAIKALIRERTKNIERLEAALALSLPAQDRKHLQQRLRGERANRQSWVDYLNKKEQAA
jgi:hypothetical protein